MQSALMHFFSILSSTAITSYNLYKQSANARAAAAQYATM